MDDDFRDRLATVWDTTRITVVIVLLALAVIGWAVIIMHSIRWMFNPC